MALVGSLATVRAQAPRTQGFATAFAYAEELLRAGSAVQARVRQVASGEAKKHELGGGVFVIEQAYPTRTRAEGFFESHRSYIDVQIVLEGDEIMEVADLAHTSPREPYNPERDLLVHTDCPRASALRVGPGDIAIFFPSDVHMPNLRVGAEPVATRKCVVKVPVE
jgi:YhcH/YjgK/YiaL family protein